MNFGGEDALELQDEDSQPGWSGLYDPWNGRRREETPFDLFPPEELYYNTEHSDYEDDVPTPAQREEMEEDEGDEDEVSLRSLSPLSPIPSRSPSPARSPSPLRRDLYTTEEEEDAPMRIPSPLRRPSPARSPTPSTTPRSLFHVEVNVRNWVVGQPYVVGFVRVPVQRQGTRRSRDEDDDDPEAPSTSRQRVNPVEEPEEDFVRRPVRILARVVPIFMREL